MRVVALIPGSIGDQILFFPTLDDLKRFYPDAEIDVVVEPRSLDAYRVCKSVNKVIPYDFNDRNSPADWGNLLGVIREREYDVAISLNQTWSKGLLLWLTGIPQRIGYAGEGQLFLTNRIPYNPNQDAASTYHDLLTALNINTPTPPLTINVPSSDVSWTEAEQKRLSITESGYVLLYGNPNQYPVSSWQKIIQDFGLRQPDLSVVFLQSSENSELVKNLTQVFPNLKVTSPGDIGKIAAIIAGASLMLCTESNPLYLAIAVQTYTIALAIAKNSDKVLPKSDRILILQSPTGNLADLPPETVLEKVWG
jgi:ADP-heptose:LPS heptosyltransferase